MHLLRHAGLVPGTHALMAPRQEGVDGRDEPTVSVDRPSRVTLALHPGYEAPAS